MPYKPMTTEEFGRFLNRYGMTHGVAAKVFGCDIRTVRRYAAGDLRVPKPMAIAIRLMQTHKTDPKSFIGRQA